MQKVSDVADATWRSGDSLARESTRSVGAEDEEDILGRVERSVEDGLVVRLRSPETAVHRKAEVLLVVGLRAGGRVSVGEPLAKATSRLTLRMK